MSNVPLAYTHSEGSGCNKSARDICPVGTDQCRVLMVALPVGTDSNCRTTKNMLTTIMDWLIGRTIDLLQAEPARDERWGVRTGHRHFAMGSRNKVESPRPRLQTSLLRQDGCSS